MSVPVGAAGGVTLWGGWATVPVAALGALACPSRLEAVTRTRTVWPTSAAAEGVGGTRRTGDVRPCRGVRRALPLVGEAPAGGGPRTGCGGERAGQASGAGDRGRDRAHRRRRLDRGSGRTRRAGSAVGVAGGDEDADVGVLVCTLERVADGVRSDDRRPRRRPGRWSAATGRCRCCPPRTTCPGWPSTSSFAAGCRSPRAG